MYRAVLGVKDNRKGMFLFSSELEFSLRDKACTPKNVKQKCNTEYDQAPQIGSTIHMLQSRTVVYAD